MTELMPYVVSVFCAVISGVVSILICLMQIRRNKEESDAKYERDKEMLQKEMEFKLQQIREETAYNAGAQIITDITNNAMNAVLESPAMKDEINRRTAQSIRNRVYKNSNKSKRRR